MPYDPIEQLIEVTEDLRPVLRQGQSGHFVKILRRCLAAHGYGADWGVDPSRAVSAEFDDHLAALANGASVPVPVYDYAIHNRSDRVRMVEPARIIVVDGILVLWDRALRERFDLKIFVDTAADIRLIRRLRRDVAERGRTPEFVIEQYLDTVRPAHERFIEPSKRHADVIIPEGGLNRPALEVLLARVRELAVADG